MLIPPPPLIFVPLLFPNSQLPLTMNILVLKNSVKGETGSSNILIGQVLSQIAGSHTVVTRDLASMSLPSINGDFVRAMWTPEKGDAEKAVLAQAFGFIEDLKSADMVVIGSPVYNFNVAASLKTFFDMTVMNGVTFHYVDGKPKGLLAEGKKAVICYTSGGTALGGDLDYNSGWVKHMLGFVGIADVTIVDGGLGQYPGKEERMAKAEEVIKGIVF